MTVPFSQENLFEINENLQPVLTKIENYEYVIIDNFYKRPDDINQCLKQSWIQSWKKNDNGHNFKDYYDCRSFYPIKENKTESFFKTFLNIENQYCDVISTNVFSWINPPAQKFQFWPHQDSGLNIIVYLDKICSGGTALYDKMPVIETSEDIDIRFDIEKAELKVDLIQAVYNRCVVFNGQIPHGGYISNHESYTGENWRYNAVYFFKDIRYK